MSNLPQNTGSDRNIDDPLPWGPRIINDNKFTQKIDPNILRLSTLKSSTLGVENELRRFATTEYLNKGKNIKVVGSDDTPIDESLIPDDLLLTNAVSENKVQDDIDKTRYLKETRSYVNIHSSSRNKKNKNMQTNSYNTRQIFLPMQLDIYFTTNNGFIHVTANNNQMNFSLKNFTNPYQPKQMVTSKSNIIWTVFITPSIYTIDQLATIIQNNSNLLIMQELKIPNFFSITTSQRSLIINCSINYQFIWNFNIDKLSQTKNFNKNKELLVDNNLKNIYPNPDQYVVTLDKSYTNVKSLRIIASQLPNTGTIVDIRNNRITFHLLNSNTQLPIKRQNQNESWVFYLQPGNYTVITLAEALELGLNNMIFGEAGLANIFQVTVNEITGLFEISSLSPYVFKWEFSNIPELDWRNLFKMLGFQSSTGLNPDNYVSVFNNLVGVNTGTENNPNYIEVPYGNFNLRKPTIIWLKLNNYETIYDNYTQKYYFAQFNINCEKHQGVSNNSFTDIVTVFNDSPIPNLDILDISFYDELGFPYNFKNIDHTFTLEITCHMDRLMGNDFSSYRGTGDKTSYI